MCLGVPGKIVEVDQRVGARGVLEKCSRKFACGTFLLSRAFPEKDGLTKGLPLQVS
jgi:hypothetical protein